jgi:uncharacterized protein
MKYLLVLAVLWVGVWAWRRGRNTNRPTAERNTAVAQEEMVRCAHCGLHLPRGDALQDAGKTPAVYCSAEHRARSEHP